MCVFYRGISLTFYGYSPKLPALADTVSRDVGSPEFWQKEVDSSLIENCKDRMLRNLRSCTQLIWTICCR
jgi:hypothetical protein